MMRYTRDNITVLTVEGGCCGMRPIDADALMESIGCADAVKYGNRDRAEQDISYRTMMLYEIRNEIDAQPTVGGWISVKDDLPKTGTLALVFGSAGAMTVARYIAGAEWVVPGMFSAITHWMPLPAPPKE
jgi:hypothetical protein